MSVSYDVIWGFQEDILKLRGRFKERVWLAHLSQPMGISLHKYKGKVNLDENKIAFSGREKDTLQPSELTVPRQKILEVYLGWDDVIRRWRDTRAGIKPLRITFKTNDEIRIIYLYAKLEKKAVYGKENRRLYEELREIKQKD